MSQCEQIQILSVNVPRLDTTDVDHSENEDITMKSLAESEKPRGRKRGITTTPDDKPQDSKPKRGRKKAPAVSEEPEEAWAEDSSLADTTMEMEDEQNSPPKRGRRGRPPKSTALKEEAPPKGRRGRKKAAPPPEEEAEEEQEEEEDGEEAGSENIEVKPKAGRGRGGRRAGTRLVTKTLLFLNHIILKRVSTEISLHFCICNIDQFQNIFFL